MKLKMAISVKQFLGRQPGIIFLFSSYFLFILLISPFREMALNDDWIYALTVKELLETFNIKINDYTAASLVFQAIWGGLFTLWSQSFFSMLRISTLVLSLGGGIAFYLILKEIKFEEGMSTLGAFCLAINPIYFNLSYTFMTDIPAVALILFSLFFYLKGINSNSNKYLLIGSVFSSLSFLTRQNGLSPSLSIIAFLLLHRRKYPLGFRRICSCILIPLLTVVIYFCWYAFINTPTWANVVMLKATIGKIEHTKLFIRDFIFRIFAILQYLGLFISPFLLGGFFSWTKIIAQRRRVGPGVFLLWVVIIILGVCLGLNKGRMMPYLYVSEGVIINPYGLGGQTLSGSVPLFLPPEGWLIVTAISSLGAVFLGTLFTFKVVDFFSSTKGVSDFFYIFGLFIAISSLVYGHYFDNYLVPLLPIAILLVLEFVKGFGIKKWLLWVGLIIIGIYSMIGTLDYLNWNEASWEAGRYLLSQGVPIDSIDGTLEWKGWFLFESSWKKLKDKNAEMELWDWLKVVDPKYVISHSSSPYPIRYSPRKFGERYNEYRIYKKIPYKTSFGLRERFIYILEGEGK